ncbi:hypothetical protein [Deinococcus pimensis]|uniref:hypothetical protein n=1 Tax=Deinococcus pimensis TaxID=309888 RepID=UPI00047F0A83|nr:hypothetical protein [Deinococcus pimensis]
MININLLPKELRRSTGPDFWRLGAGAAAVVTLATIGVLHFTVTSTLGDLNRQIDEVQGEINILQPKVQERDKLRATKASLQSVTAVADALKAGQTSWSGDLAKFVRQLPSGARPLVALESLDMKAVDNPTPSVNYDGKTVSKEVNIRGSASSSASLVTFLNAFEASPEFGVQFKSANLDETTGDYKFDATVGLVRSTPVAAADTSGAGTTAAGTDVAAAPAAPAGGAR